MDSPSRLQRLSPLTNCYPFSHLQPTAAVAFPLTTESVVTLIMLLCITNVHVP